MKCRLLKQNKRYYVSDGTFSAQGTRIEDLISKGYIEWVLRNNKDLQNQVVLHEFAERPKVKDIKDLKEIIPEDFL